MLSIELLKGREWTIKQRLKDWEEKGWHMTEIDLYEILHDLKRPYSDESLRPIYALEGNVITIHYPNTCKLRGVLK